MNSCKQWPPKFLNLALTAIEQGLMLAMRKDHKSVVDAGGLLLADMWAGHRIQLWPRGILPMAWWAM